MRDKSVTVSIAFFWGGLKKHKDHPNGVAFMHIIELANITHY